MSDLLPLMIVKEENIYHKDTTEHVSSRVCETDIARLSAGCKGRLQMFLDTSQKFTVDASQMFLGRSVLFLQAIIMCLWHFGQPSQRALQETEAQGFDMQVLGSDCLDSVPQSTIFFFALCLGAIN